MGFELKSEPSMSNLTLQHNPGPLKIVLTSLGLNCMTKWALWNRKANLGVTAEEKNPQRENTIRADF